VVAAAGGAQIVGVSNMAGRIAADASALYAKNLVALSALLLDKEGNLAPQWEDEILAGAVVVRDGAVVHPALSGVSA
jgi:NAD(P) transhydrogenase subunit alpha